MILKLLAEAASDFYSIEYDELTSRSKIGRNRYACRVRHICQWVACEVLTPQYKKSIVAGFWGVDRTAVYYGCRMVRMRMNRRNSLWTFRARRNVHRITIPEEKEDLQQFIEIAGNLIPNLVMARIETTTRQQERLPLGVRNYAGPTTVTNPGPDVR